MPVSIFDRWILLGWSFFGNFKYLLRKRKKKKKDVWYGDIFKENEEEENYPTRESIKRIGNDKWYVKFTFNSKSRPSLSIYIRDISKNFRELLAIFGEIASPICVSDPKIDPDGKFRLQLYRYHCVYSRQQFSILLFPKSLLPSFFLSSPRFSI